MAYDRLSPLVPTVGAKFFPRPCLTHRHNADLLSESSGHSTAGSWSDWYGQVAATHRAGEHRTKGEGLHRYGGDRTRESWADLPGVRCDERYAADGVPRRVSLDHLGRARACHPIGLSWIRAPARLDKPLVSGPAWR